MNRTSIENFIFDLDGTLIDSKEDIAYCLKLAYQNLGFVFHSDKLIIGPPLEDIIEILTPSIALDQKQLIISEFRKNYLDSSFTRTIPYEGVIDVLEELRLQGKRLFIATNKPKNSSEVVLSALKMNYFEFVGTPDCIDGKLMEKTDLIKYILVTYCLNPHKTLMVGDTHTDIIAGKNNHLYTLAFTSGYGDKTKLGLENPTFCINHFKEILNKIK